MNMRIACVRKVKCAVLLVLSEDQIMTTKDKYYPQQSMELRCSYPESVLGRIKWLVNKKDPEENRAKYTITNDGSGSTLIVNDVSESDDGE